MFETLLESAAPRPRSVGHSAIAVAVHAGLLIGAVGVTRRPGLVLPPVVQPVLDIYVGRPAPARSREIPGRGAEVITPAPVFPPRVRYDDQLFGTSVDVRLPPVVSLPGLRSLFPGGTDSAVGISGRPFESFAGVMTGAVDSLPQPLTTIAAEYPRVLREAGVEGRVLLEFIVDTLGAVERGSLHAVGASHPAFVEAASATLLQSRFRAGWSGGRRVRVLVRQAVVFRIH